MNRSYTWIEMLIRSGIGIPSHRRNVSIGDRNPVLSEPRITRDFADFADKRRLEIGIPPHRCQFSENGSVANREIKESTV